MNKRERNDLIISWLAISFAFAAVMSGGIKGFFSLGFVTSLMPLSLITVGTAFIFHELGHRAVALRFGAHAEFRKWDTGLMLALFLGIASVFTGFGFLFAAPGAVYIYKEYMSLRENGLISVVGPLINIVVGLMFLIGLIVLVALGVQSILLVMLFKMGFTINLFLAMFNLLPFPHLTEAR
jgi:Zn-dependent protease